MYRFGWLAVLVLGAAGIHGFKRPETAPKPLTVEQQIRATYDSPVLAPPRHYMVTPARRVPVRALRHRPQGTDIR